MNIRVIKLVLSFLFAMLWFAATVCLGYFSIILFFPLIILVFCPEILLLWGLLLLLILFSGGWIEEEKFNQLSGKEPDDVIDV